VQRAFLLDVVVRQRATILELLAREDEALLVRRDALLVLDLLLHVVDRVRRLDVERDGLAREGLDEDLRWGRRAVGGRVVFLVSWGEGALGGRARPKWLKKAASRVASRWPPRPGPAIAARQRNRRRRAGARAPTGPKVVMEGYGTGIISA